MGAEREPAFLITIDTEGDDAWRAQGAVTTRNSAFLPRFQALCERHGLAPTWLTNHEMASDHAFVAFGRDVLARGTGEVGMHLHAWNSPPLVPLRDLPDGHQAYLIEYPDEVMAAKIDALTDLLRATFDTPIVTHRAGRWAFDERYARLLAEQGYRVDCSVTPHVSWRAKLGAPDGAGGPDYTAFPEHPYRMAADDIGRPGGGPLLQAPMTIVAPGAADLRRHLTAVGGVLGRAFRRVLPPAHWLRPTGANLHAMLAIVDRGRRERRAHLEFMLHSSELMPGGSPTFPNAASIERLYAHLDAVFAAAREAGFVGCTLSAFEKRCQEPFLAAGPAENGS